MLRPSVHMLGWCGTGLPPFFTACWWLSDPAAAACVSAVAWKMWWTVCSACLQSQSARSVMSVCFKLTCRPQCPLCSWKTAVGPCLSIRWVWLLRTLMGSCSLPSDGGISQCDSRCATSRWWYLCESRCAAIR